MNAMKIAEEFAGEPVELVEIGQDTHYADGGWDTREYYESKSGKHIVVECPYLGKPFARTSDGVVW